MNDMSIDGNRDDSLSYNTEIDRSKIDQIDLSNSQLNSTVSHSGITSETKMFRFISIAIVVLIIFLIICILIVVCICRRKRKKSEVKKIKDQLLPDTSIKSAINKESSKTPLNNASTTNGKQNISVQQNNLNSTKTTKSFYYDNLDDIPFIDDSRPTSVIDITKV